MYLNMCIFMVGDNGVEDNCNEIQLVCVNPVGKSSVVTLMEDYLVAVLRILFKEVVIYIFL